jgi:hypothetical protein
VFVRRSRLTHCFAVLLGLVALTVGFVGTAAAQGGAGKKPTCAAFLKKKSIVEIVKEEVVLTKPNPVAAVGAWQGGPRTECFATLPPPPGVTGVLTETEAVWGVGYGVTASQWNEVKSVEGGINSVEGTCPWTREAANIGRSGYHAFFARTAALSASDGSSVSYLYVLTPRKNLFYLDIRPATTSQLLGLARKILGGHPKF